MTTPLGPNDNEKRPKPKPTLEYSPGVKGPPNGPWWFILRMFLGVLLGGGSMMAGAVAASYTNMPFLFFVPTGTALILAIWLSFSMRRRGYLTGVILAPFIIALGVGVLLFMICSGSGGFR